MAMGLHLLLIPGFTPGVAFSVEQGIPLLFQGSINDLGSQLLVRSEIIPSNGRPDFLMADTRGKLDGRSWDVYTGHGSPPVKVVG